MVCKCCGSSEISQRSSDNELFECFDCGAVSLKEDFEETIK